MGFMEWPWGYFARIGLFVLYFACSIALICIVNWKNPCFVQHTYKQEFLANIVANPLFSSTALTRGPPKSALEVVYYNASENVQRVSDVYMFPTIIQNPPKYGAFMRVHSKPGTMQVAGESIQMTRLYNENIYMDDATHDIQFRGFKPMAGALRPIESAVRSGVSGDLTVGTQMPNLFRCMADFIPAEEMDSNVTSNPEKLRTWVTRLGRLRLNSHLRGTCLLTGQQDSVDVISNYRTSVVFFSSINVIFMVQVIIWISASFALFNVGAYRSSTSHIHGVSSVIAGSAKGEDSPNCCSNLGWLDDFLMFVAIAWNFIPIAMLLSTSFRVDQNIPLNNAIIGIAALLVATMVQWSWANFYATDVESFEHAAQTAIVTSPDVVRATLVYAAGDAPAKPLPATPEPRSSMATRITSMFDTSNFLETASAVKSYGAEYAATMSNIAGGWQPVSTTATTASTLRRRNTGRAYDAEGSGTRSSYAYYPLHSREQKIAALASMPNFSYMVQTGSPFVIRSYLNIIKAEMFNDSIQSMEYTITSPLLFATILAAISKSVSTGMVQWAFGAMVASHLLTIPILYSSHLSSCYKERYPKHFHWGSHTMGTLMLLVACAIMQAIGLTVTYYYIVADTATPYYTSENIKGAVWFLFAMQLFFVLAVVTVSIAGITGMQGFETLAKWMSVGYTATNLLTKLIVGFLLQQAAANTDFPVSTCDVWSGTFLHNA